MRPKYHAISKPSLVIQRNKLMRGSEHKANICFMVTNLQNYNDRVAHEKNGRHSFFRSHS